MSSYDWSKAEKQDVIVVGSGPAGCTAALYISRAGYHPIVLHGVTPGGQLTGTTDLENFPGWKGTGPDLVEALEAQATAAGAEYRYEVITDCDLSASPFKLSTDVDTHYLAKTLIICTGANAMYLGIDSEKQYMAKGVSGCATCDGPLYKGRDVFVIGGGDAAVEEALFLSHLCKSVHLVHRRHELRASVAMKKKLEASTVQMVWDSTVEEILGDGKKVTGIKTKNVLTNEVTQHPTDGVFVAIGHKPATSPFSKYVECDSRGYFVTHGSPATNVPGIFVAGDCADHVYRQAITSAGTGCQAALLAERFLMDQK